ncbi:WPP domain-interacting tail-anchored protein 1 isoform X1 [Lolium perenne]|uniref:WPP domain-interacting tail-anchored protein 1 isoform X1 n=1 Tax=Lolium perenne TaxID=4522 RepID=UPI0021EA4E77|nr:WPP domain-interacting tail-anchored protein 1-like isoform X1 [Lolium perenne]
MDSQITHDDDGFQETDRSQGNGSNGEVTTADIVSRVELEVSFGSEKLLNLQMLLMEVAHRAYDIEALMLDPDSLSTESLKKAFEFDALYGILDSEVSELEKLVGSIQTDIGSVEKEVNEEESEGRLKGKLHAATKALVEMKELISTIRRESENFDKVMDPSHQKSGTGEGGAYENGHASSPTTMQAEDQRNVLHMLEQSIANELDLEKKLSDSGAVVEELKMKLHHVEQDSYFLEESVEAISERTFAAENASELFLGISKELTDRISTMQSELSASGRREDDLKSKLEQSLVQLNALEGSSEMAQDISEKDASKEAMQSQRSSTPELFTLQHKLQKLEEWPSGGANEKMQNMSVSEISTFENIINDIKDTISKAESRAQNAEARCVELTQANVQLNGELNSLKSHGSNRADLLEQKLMESDAQLEHARASLEAISEHQGMLRSSISDMEHMIQDLKEKYSKAETRAESAESKCTLLTDTNLELSEELSFLRGRVESLENSLRHANRQKLSTAKDIGIKTKTISDLVAKLALERERLHLQIVALTKKNRMLAQKCKENASEGILLSKSIAANEGELTNVTEEVLLTSSPMQTQVKTAADNLGGNEAVIAALLEDESGTLETVRSIQPTQLNWKYIFAALFVLLAATLVHLLTQSVVPGLE